MSSRNETIKYIRAEAANLLLVADSLELLSDEMFDRLFPNGSHPAIIQSNESQYSKYVVPASASSETTESLEGWGDKKRIVLEIISEKERALLKNQIVEEFEYRTMTTDQENTVTNALTALRVDGKIEGGKVKGIKFRGKYWGLPEWFENEELKEQFIPNHAKFHRMAETGSNLFK